VKEAGRTRYRCHTGHAYSLQSLLAEAKEAVEDAQWNALRAMQEREMMLRHAAEHLRNGDGAASSALLAEADREHHRAETLRELIQASSSVLPENSDSDEI
jgi:two-component system chemotaxis response regulator CheB